MGDLQLRKVPMTAGDPVVDEQQCRVLCAQIGARDHYAMPRALHRRGALMAMVTDFWWPWGGTAKLPLLRRVTGRSHGELRGARVLAMDWATLGSEALRRMGQTDRWAEIIGRNEWFQARALRRIPWAEFSGKHAGDRPPVLFAYSYAALRLLRHAKQLGWKTLLGQIDPGPFDARIAEEESQRWPEFGASWQPPPSGYFDDWRKELKLADRIIVNSEWSRRALLDEGVASERIDVIPLPCEDSGAAGQPPKVYPAGFDAARPLRVLFLGQVNLRKGVPELLAAMESLRSSAIELWVAGPLRLDLPARFAASPNIRWLGAITRDQVAGLYRDADVFVFPTHSDGFGLTQLEAQSWRVPVIASKHCGAVVVDGENGMVLDEVTPQCIREALLCCCENPHRLRKWSEGAGIAPRFRLDATGHALLEAIRKVR
jgi:glycosyltransferase involved in cell wall biosynthesis